MPWKTEIDRIVSRALFDAAKGGQNEVTRALRTVEDLLALAPERAASHFHLGAAEELLGDAAAGLPDSQGDGQRWRHLGVLDAAARRGNRDRLRELIDDEHFEEALDNPEGRVALRAVGRMLLRDGEDQRVFDYYTRHLKAVDDEGSRRDAEFLLEEALRRADRYERGERNEEEALARLDRAAAFAEAAGLDPRAGAKVDRKMGRVHQLSERWEDAAACYRRALEHLPAEDPYRSVLVGDLALATLGVRGTLDLLPQEDRPQREEARAILQSEGEQGEGRSYNAIYTLGMLCYEAGDHEAGARCFREADELMRENRAKARIVHARSRFFLGHCMLQAGAEGEELDQARKYVQRDAGPSNLDPEYKDPVFEALREVLPDARLPGRGGPRRGRERAAPAAAPPAATAADHLEEARALLQDDPHHALELVDKTFRSRPDFDTWFGAYRTRLEALIALNEREEALRTYERFRAKLYQRETLDRIESLLLDPAGPMADLLDDAAYNRELVDLYEVMPGREGQFVEQCITCAQSCLEGGGPRGIECAVAMLQAAQVHDDEAVKDLLAEALEAAAEAGVDVEAPSAEECRKQVEAMEEQPHILLVGGDEGRRPHLERLKQLADEIGFEASWIFTGARPPQKTFEEIEDTAQDSSAILLHHRTEPEVVEEVRRLAAELEIPLRESAWLGTREVEAQVLRTLRAFASEA